MFIDAAAIVAILAGEQEADRCSLAILSAAERFTSAIAVWESVIALARADKLNIPIDVSEQLVTQFLDERAIVVRDLPPADAVSALSLEAARRFRTGAQRLNLADCFHYACARYAEVPILSTADEFRFTDLQVAD